MAKTINVTEMTTEKLQALSLLNCALIKEERLKQARTNEQKPLRKVANSDSATKTEKNEAIIKIEGVAQKYKPLLDAQKKVQESALSELFDDSVIAEQLYVGYLYAVLSGKVDRLHAVSKTPVQLTKGIKTIVDVSFADAITKWFDSLGIKLDDGKALRRTIAKVGNYASSVRMKLSLGKDGKYKDGEGNVVATYVRTSSRKKILQDIVLAFLHETIVESVWFDVTEDGLISLRPTEEVEGEFDTTAE